MRLLTNLSFCHPLYDGLVCMDDIHIHYTYLTACSKLILHRLSLARSRSTCPQLYANSPSGVNTHNLYTSMKVCWKHASTSTTPTHTNTQYVCPPHCELWIRTCLYLFHLTWRSYRGQVQPRLDRYQTPSGSCQSLVPTLTVASRCRQICSYWISDTHLSTRRLTFPLGFSNCTCLRRIRNHCACRMV